MATQVYTKDQGQGKGEKVSRPLAGLAFYRERGDEFRSLGAGRYEVPSRSSKSRRHEVNIEQERCSCNDARIRGRMCAHIMAVTIAIAKKQPIPTRERIRFTPEQIQQNLNRMSG